MTYEERKKWICEQCNKETDCAYVNRNMEYKCLLVEERMEGWELGWQDAIEKACEWLEERQVVDLEVPNIEKFIEDFKKAMEEQQ